MLKMSPELIEDTSPQTEELQCIPGKMNKKETHLDPW